MATWLGFFAACNRTPVTKPNPASTAQQAIPPIPTEQPTTTPASTATFRTTSEVIELGNLDASINGALKRKEAARSATDGAAHAARATAGLLLRGQITGRIADYEQAQVLAEFVVKNLPQMGDSYLLRAKLHTTFHAFDLAQKDLAAAKKYRASADAVASEEAALLSATGHFAEAQAIVEPLAKAFPNLAYLAALAGLRSDLGYTEEAAELFVRAQTGYRDASPIPLAGLYLREGLMWQKAGKLTRARELFQNAVDRLPAYAPAVSHLASVLAVTGDKANAEKLLTTLVEKSDDPEYRGQLALLKRELGKADEAQKLEDEADARYQELTKKYPLAFGDHAARFWIAAKRNLPEAYKLAALNLKNRPTADAHSLAVEAALAAEKSTEACKTADALVKLPYRDANSLLMAAKAYQVCNRPADAEKTFALVAK